MEETIKRENIISHFEQDFLEKLAYCQELYRDGDEVDEWNSVHGYALVDEDIDEEDCDFECGGYWKTKTFLHVKSNKYYQLYYVTDNGECYTHMNGCTFTEVEKYTEMVEVTTYS